MLYFIATPIGNLKEITFRAVETLGEVDEIYCEDTRRSLVLLNHYKIKKPLFSFEKFNESKRIDEIIQKLLSGTNIAVISDAGMPLISDPGNILSRVLSERGLEFTVISGACAVINAVVLSGMDTSSFFMCGFLPEKKSLRTQKLQKIADLESTLVFYCPPHDVKKTLKEIGGVLGDRRVSIVREISKKFEEVIKTTLLSEAEITLKGEMVLVVEGASIKNISVSDEEIKEILESYISQGFSRKDAVEKTAKDTRQRKSYVYKLSIE